MKVIVHQDRVDTLIDVLLERWCDSPKRYPFNRKDAVLPQKIIPEEIRKDKFVLACFYFYACIYMRGGIESLQAFSALIKMWRAHGWLFNPAAVAIRKPEDVQSILKKFIGWDSKVAAQNWVENSKRLMQTWRGNPLNLLVGLRDYDEALRRIKNKLTKREQREAGIDGHGFRGKQAKMVSMLLYFYDWEGWLKPRFAYPSPADLHNFRIGLSGAAIEVFLEEGKILRAGEKLSKPWRDAVLTYIKKRKADPVSVADVLWLFSLTMCGNSPVTLTKELKTSKPLFVRMRVEEEWNHEGWLAKKGVRALEQTCLICPFEKGCRIAVPARPYYTKGKLILRPRAPVDPRINKASIPEPKSADLVIEPEVLKILDMFKVPKGA